MHTHKRMGPFHNLYFSLDINGYQCVCVCARVNVRACVCVMCMSERIHTLLQQSTPSKSYFLTQHFQFNHIPFHIFCLNV